VLLYLLRLGRPGDYAGNIRLAGEPADRQGQHTLAQRVRNILEFAEYVEVPLGEDLLPARAPGGQTRILRGRLALAVLTGQEAACQREVWQHSQPVGIAGGHHFALYTPVQQVVFVLRGDERREVIHAGRPLRVGDLPAAEVGTADVAHLARAHQVIHRW